MQHKEGKTMKYAMVIDLTKCVGCNSCTAACKIDNSTGFGVKYGQVLELESGSFPDVTKFYLPILCMQCENPECLKVCPTGATFKTDDGIVLIDKNKCMGCRYCAAACPYMARYFYDDSGRPLDVPRMDLEDERHGTAEKCDFCIDRVREGENPACVQACPYEARTFGDIDDPSSRVHSLMSRAKSLKEEEGFNVSVYYIW
ncbi:MAG: 4Fe-4S dicluster domain-containing protein [Thaumarchaeota archaeon]|nr:4Fe-4S dicluster domain-containing protein [Nitrososphaerota archaeon]